MFAPRWAIPSALRQNQVSLHRAQVVKHHNVLSESHWSIRLVNEHHALEPYHQTKKQESASRPVNPRRP
jgi:hypothetical protein